MIFVYDKRGNLTVQPEGPLQFLENSPGGLVAGTAKYYPHLSVGKYPYISDVKSGFDNGYSLLVNWHAMVLANTNLYFGHTNTKIAANTDGADLTISADDDLILAPDDDLVIKVGSTTWATFDGGNQRLGIGTATPQTTLTVEGTVTLKEQAAADSDTAAYGQIWVKSDSPNKLYFTDDAGTDTQLGGGGAIADNILATQIFS